MTTSHKLEALALRQGCSPREVLERATARHHWNTSAVAADLGVSRASVYRWLREVGLLTADGRRLYPICI